MSRDKDESIGFTVAEKLVALLILLLGAILTYNTATSPSIVYAILFGVGGLTLVMLGILIIFTKTK